MNLEEKELKNICSGKLTKDELKEFIDRVADIDEEYSGFFEKYYNLEYILNILNKLKDKVIDDEYAKLWVSTYMDILLGFKKDEDDEYNLIDYFKCNIIEALDSLFMFLDEEDDIKYTISDIDYYIKASKENDELYKKANTFRAYLNESKEDVILYIINDENKRMRCILLDTQNKYFFTSKKTDVEFISYRQSQKLEKELFEKGYIEDSLV